MAITQTKEEWLTNAVLQLEAEFKNEGLTMPAKWRISSGFPSKGGLAVKKRTIGQCWSPEASKDGTTEIIISITQDDALIILGVIAHEMVHATGIMNHGPKFKSLATAIGLTGKMTATEEGVVFIQRTMLILERLGEFPHAALDHTIGQKKQSTRMVKVSCDHEDCGMVFRTSNKWIEESMGQMACPICEGSTTIG
tara:strand:- start:101 stop:688 length:588 start_codon:yes stop_codon:yes gene_type:complete